MQTSARTAAVTGTLQVGGQPDMPVGLSLESAYLIVETRVNRDAVAVEFLRRSRVNNLWQLERTDRPGWQISLSDIPAAWLPQVRRAALSPSYLLLITGLTLFAVLLFGSWVLRLQGRSFACVASCG